MKEAILLIMCSIFSEVFCFPNLLSPTEQCREPHNYQSIRSTLKSQIERDYYNDLGSVIFPDYYAGYKPNSEDPNAKVNVSETVEMFHKLYGNVGFNCDKEKERVLRASNTRHPSKREQHERSVCPWDILLDFDPLRIPASIAKARCLCQECLSKETLRQGETGHHPEVGCVPINSYIPVILKTCIQGEYVYRVEMNAVPVGCTCGRLL